MDLAIELVKCKEAAERLRCTPKVMPVCGGDCHTCNTARELITTALLEARADAAKQSSIRLAEINVEYGWLNDLADKLQAEVHARRQRGL